MFTNHIHSIYMYKQDLALNNLQWLICHKTQPNQIKPNINLLCFYFPHYLTALVVVLKYADYTPCRKVRPLPNQKSSSVLSTDCIWWWGSRTDALESVQYSLIALTPKFTRAQHVSTCSVSIYSSDKTVEKLFVFVKKL